jgi:hypothetical protein
MRADGRSPARRGLQRATPASSYSSARETNELVPSRTDDKCSTIHGTLPPEGGEDMPIWRGQLASEDVVRSRCSVRRERLSRLMVWPRTARKGPSILGLAFTAALGTSRQSSTTRPTTVEATVSPIAADSSTDPLSNPRRLTAVLRCGWDLNRAPDSTKEGHSDDHRPATIGWRIVQGSIGCPQ